MANNGGLSFVTSENGFVMPTGRRSTDEGGCRPSIQRIESDGTIEEVYVACDGVPLVAPNDLVFDQHGGFYFTDTGRPQGRLCDLGGVYYASADGSRITEVLHHPEPGVPPTQPNGVALSPDGKRLYVAETVTGRLWGWAIESPGRLGPLPGSSEIGTRGAGLLYGWEGFAFLDSMAVDAEGNICVGTLRKGGVSVIDPDGGLKAFLPIASDPHVTNVCFGGPDLRTAYVTTGWTGSIWEIEWPHPGLPLAFDGRQSGAMAP